MFSALLLTALSLGGGCDPAPCVLDHPLGVLTPLDELGAGLYGGLSGGLYPGGTNTPPHAHVVAGLRESLDVVPRDASGAPSASGKIGMISIGPSNAKQDFARYANLAAGDPAVNDALVFVNSALPSTGSQLMVDPAAFFWSHVATRVAAAGLTPQQVQVAWMMAPTGQPEAYYASLGVTTFAARHAIERDNLIAVLHNLRTKYPNLRVCYLASRTWGGYATINSNPEPYAYEQGFSSRALIELQLAGDPLVDFDDDDGVATTPWVTWGRYFWADGCNARADGVAWLCEDFSADGQHPSALGEAKAAALLHAHFGAEPSARRWYFDAPAPLVYGASKLTSAGGLLAIGSSGAPSIGAGGFALTLSGAIPGKNAIAYYGAQPANAPFLGHVRWTTTPFQRLGVRTADALGQASWSEPFVGALAGDVRCYQIALRDPAQLDGTKTCLSDALFVVTRP